MSKVEATRLVEEGKGFMPSFRFLSDSEKQALVGFLFGEVSDSGGEKVEAGIPYTHTGYNRFLDADGYPAVKPPWGTLNAIDLNAGVIKWTVPLGEFPELTKRGIPQTGTENYGGPVVTAGGLLFIAATKDEKFRAFDKTNRQGTLGNKTSCRRLCDALYLHGQRKTVCSHRRRRRQDGHSFRR